MDTHQHNPRKAGITTQQMLRSPNEALYIWPVAAGLSYALRLARHLGRGDLVIVEASGDLTQRFRGKLSRAVVIDHRVSDCSVSVREDAHRLYAFVNGLEIS